MNLEKLRDQREIDEGVKDEIYNEHLGYPTFGVGHWGLETDPEYNDSIGTSISESRVIEAFEQDCDNVLLDCTILYPDFYDLPEEAQQIIANMMFSLGRTRLSKFKGMKRGVDAQEWHAAAEEMVASRWYSHCPFATCGDADDSFRER
mgnify:CR=1 FL=1